MTAPVIAPTIPSISWFRDPGLTEPTPLTVTPDGRVYGHLCEWNRAHIAFGGRKVHPPRGDDMRFFLTGATDVLDDDGSRVEISVGKLTMNTGHASTALGVTADAAAAHYDHTGTIAALVNAGSDSIGVWMAGMLMPDLDEVTTRRFRACGASGDWRQIEGKLRLVAALSVPVGGFPIPRARVASGAPLALVAAGMVPPRQSFGLRVDPAWQPAPLGLDVDAFADKVADRLAERQRVQALAAQARALLAQVDDAPQRLAALVASLDDTAERQATLLAELEDEDSGEDYGVLDKSPGKNWIEDLPAGLKARWNKSIIYRAATHMHQERGMPVGKAIASAVNWSKHICQTGDVKQWKGPQNVNPKSRAEACAAVALWEEMRAAAKADN